MKRRIASHYTLVNGRLERDIIVDVDTNGTITAISHCANIDSEAHVEFYPGILIPGMINAHCHLELSYLLGAIAEAGGYATFASEIGRVRGNFSHEERLHAAYVADAAMWEQGIEVVADIANDDLVMPEKERSHIEYYTLFELFGLNNHNGKYYSRVVEKSKKRSEKHCRYDSDLGKIKNNTYKCNNSYRNYDRKRIYKIGQSRGKNAKKYCPEVPASALWVGFNIKLFLGYSRAILQKRAYESTFGNHIQKRS